MGDQQAAHIAETDRLAVVRWEDTTNIAAWSDRAEVEDFATNGAWICENVGWVLVDDDRCVVLAARRTIDGQHVGLYERIPRQAVLAVTYLYQPPECDIPGCDHRRSTRGYALTHSDGKIAPERGTGGKADRASAPDSQSTGPSPGDQFDGDGDA